MFSKAFFPSGHENQESAGEGLPHDFTNIPQYFCGVYEMKKTCDTPSKNTANITIFQFRIMTTN